MTKTIALLTAAALCAVVPVTSSAVAAPISGAAMTQAAPNHVETVRWRGHRGGGWGGVGAGFAAGAILGGLLASPGYYYGPPAYYGPTYYYGPGYYAPPPRYYGGGDAYCAQRFRSYDPMSGTYLGYDGFRHPCP